MSPDERSFRVTRGRSLRVVISWFWLFAWIITEITTIIKMIWTVIARAMTGEILVDIICRFFMLCSSETEEVSVGTIHVSN